MIEEWGKSIIKDKKKLHTVNKGQDYDFHERKSTGSVPLLLPSPFFLPSLPLFLLSYKSLEFF